MVLSPYPSFKKSLFYFLLVLVSLVVTELNAQDFRPGFIVLQNADSVKGFVAYQSVKKNSAECLFRDSKKSDVKTYYPGEIASYGMSGYKHFESRRFPLDTGKVAFMEVLVKGTISLYKDQLTFYAEKESIRELPRPMRRANKVDTRYAGILNFMMADCKQNVDKVRYEEESLVATVKAYNECQGANQVIYKSHVPVWRVEGLISAGWDIGWVELEGFDAFSDLQSKSLPVGLGARVSFPRASDRVFAVFELYYDKKVYQTYEEILDEDAVIRADFLVKFSYLKMPVGFQFNLGNEARTPYLKFGLFITSCSTWMVS